VVASNAAAASTLKRETARLSSPFDIDHHRLQTRLAPRFMAEIDTLAGGIAPTFGLLVRDSNWPSLTRSPSRTTMVASAYVVKPTSPRRAAQAHLYYLLGAPG